MSDQFGIVTFAAGLAILSTSDKAALVAFMKSLTDSTFLTDMRFPNPFVTAASSNRP